jgi:glycosyltransferase involved in cell wall biosynthesis
MPSGELVERGGGRGGGAEWPASASRSATRHPPPATGHPLLVFADDWGRHPSSCQHLVRHLVTRYRVVWVNTIGTRPPRLDRATLARGWEKLRHWAGRAPAAAPGAGPPGPRVLSPTMWPWFRSAADRRLNRALLVRQLTPVLGSLPAPPIAVTTLPIAADLIGVLPVARWVYYCVDDFGQWPGLDGATLARMERDLVARADVLIAAGVALQEKLAGEGRQAHLLTHGVDLDHWAGGAGERPLPQLDGLPRPLVVFWGLIDRRMDVAFLARLAADLRAGTIVLVGPQSDPDPALDRIGRVARRPALPYAQLPALARAADVLIMPYADLPVTRAMQPLKLAEYLATGKPVVVRDLPSTRAWADALDRADTPAAFAQAVGLRLRTGLPAPQGAARSRLVAEGWAEKARAFEQFALDVGPPAERPHDARR